MAYATKWDTVGTRRYQTGVSHGVLYRNFDTAQNKDIKLPAILKDKKPTYNMGYAWSGLTTVTLSPEGAEATALYADNIKYLNLISAEDLKFTIEAYMYPDAFAACNGEASYDGIQGLRISAQKREAFGFSFRSKIGTDENADFGYKLHLIYGCTAAPSEESSATVNDSPEAASFSWSVNTTPQAIDVESDGIEDFKPTAHIVIDSTAFEGDTEASARFKKLLSVLYGEDGVSTPCLPSIAEVINILKGTLTETE